MKKIKLPKLPKPLCNGPVDRKNGIWYRIVREEYSITDKQCITRLDFYIRCAENGYGYIYIDLPCINKVGILEEKLAPNWGNLTFFDSTYSTKNWFGRLMSPDHINVRLRSERFSASSWEESIQAALDRGQLTFDYLRRQIELHKDEINPAENAERKFLDWKKRVLNPRIKEFTRWKTTKPQ